MPLDGCDVNLTVHTESRSRRDKDSQTDSTAVASSTNETPTQTPTQANGRDWEAGQPKPDPFGEFVHMPRLSKCQLLHHSLVLVAGDSC